MIFGHVSIEIFLSFNFFITIITFAIFIHVSTIYVPSEITFQSVSPMTLMTSKPHVGSLLKTIILWFIKNPVFLKTGKYLITPCKHKTQLIYFTDS